MHILRFPFFFFTKSTGAANGAFDTCIQRSLHSKKNGIEDCIKFIS